MQVSEAAVHVGIGPFAFHEFDGPTSLGYDEVDLPFALLGDIPVQVCSGASIQ